MVVVRGREVEGGHEKNERTVAHAPGLESAWLTLEIKSKIVQCAREVGKAADKSVGESMG